MSNPQTIHPFATPADAPPSGLIQPRNPSKRPVALSGISSTVEERNPDFLCPICFDVIREPMLTRCGHSFCYVCIFQSIDTFKRCPKCNQSLTTASHIFPNRLLGELITRYENRRCALEHVNASSTMDIMDVVDTSTTAAGNASAAAAGTTAAVAALATTGAGSRTMFTGLGTDGLRHFIASESKNLGLNDVQAMLEILQQRKQMLEVESTFAQNSLLHEFLQQLLSQKQEQKLHLQREIDLVQRDVHDVLAMLSDGNADQPAVASATTTATSDNCGDVGEAGPGTPPPPVVMTREVMELLDRMDTSPTASVDTVVEPPAEPATATTDELLSFNSLAKTPSASYLTRKRRMYAHFDDFTRSYFSVRSRDLHLPVAAAAAATGAVASDPVRSASPKIGRHGLDVFRDNLVKFSRYTSMRPLATMNYSSDSMNSTIVSSIVFDKDNEFFAIGGVTKRIKVFDYMAVVRDTVDMHYPSIEMVNTSKISCIAWNLYQKNVLATSDYEGMVSIWDVNTGQRKSCLHEHEKRCWSVDFNEVDSRLIASGSDDARVKLWSTNDERSIATLEAKANVCCVKFNPKSSMHLAFGSADHDVHYYDMRILTKPLSVFKGHKKAVSYVKFLNGEEIVSASTDSQLKMWNVSTSPHCLRTFTGHVNEKNFVGLTTDSDYLACGSEDNALYVYYKGLSKQLFNYRIDAGVVSKKSGGGPTDALVGVVDPSRVIDPNEFLSAVCWRKGSNVLLAANSRGLVKVLELI